MKIVYPNYQESLANLSNSILKYYGLKTYHESLKELDTILQEKEYKNIVLILYDGMGSNLLKRNLAENSFLNQNKIRDIYAVFPPTTTASTTSVLTGKYPNEHGWLGWDLYFKEKDRVITMFTNKYKDTDIEVSQDNISEKTYPYESILKKIATKLKTVGLFPFKETKYKDLKEMHQKIEQVCKEKAPHFIYAYYDNPDYTMHRKGTLSKEAIEVFQDINKETEDLCKKLKDTFVIVIADHGHINSNYITLKEYPELFDCLERDISIEARACSFKIKRGKKKQFVEQFQRNFSKDFLLFSKEEVIQKKLFGLGKNNLHFQEVIGDYLAIAIQDKYFRYDENGKKYISMHAGLTEDEMLVPLIVYRS